MSLKNCLTICIKSILIHPEGMSHGQSCVTAADWSIRFAVEIGGHCVQEFGSF